MTQVPFAAAAVSGGFPDPGTVARLDMPVDAPAAIPAAAAILLLTLADADAPIRLEGADALPEASAWLAFHTGARTDAAPGEASFALLTENSDPAGWQVLPIGTDAYPDRAATLILPVDALEGGAPLTLTGPGIETTRTIAPVGLPAGFLEARARNAALFPRGHDLVLVAGDALIALPRTTKLREA